MTSRTRVSAVLCLSFVALACGKKEEAPQAVTPAASPAPGMATVAPAMTPLPEATMAPPPAAATMAPRATGSPAARPTASAATVPPPAATQPAAPPPATAAPPATSAPAAPATTQPAAPSRPAAKRPTGKVTLPAKLGAVTFDHEAHAGKRKVACATCHHPSRPQKPLAAEQQACRDCHTMPAAPPMKTSLQAAFHDPRAGTGLCIDCHKKQVAAGAAAPTKCTECHKKK